jgi:hypothetical protein
MFRPKEESRCLRLGGIVNVQMQLSQCISVVLGVT